MKRPILRLALILGITTLAAWACHDATNMVEPGLPRRASMNIVPSFDVAVGGPVIKLAKVRAIVSIFPTGEKVIDTIANFDPTKNELKLELTVLLTEPSKQFMVNLAAMDANGDTVFKAVDTLVVRQPSAATSSTPTPVTIPLTYSGADTVVKTLAVAPRDTTIVVGDSVQMRVKGFRTDASEVSNVRAGWTVKAADTSKVRINDNGTIVARVAFSDVWIYGRTATGITDSTKFSAVNSQPNLKPTLLIVTPNPLLPASQAEIIYAVKNEGGPTTDTTSIRFAVTEVPDTGDVFGIARRKLRAMAAGEIIKDTIILDIPPDATPDEDGAAFNLIMFVDCKDRHPYLTLEDLGGDNDDRDDEDDDDPNFQVCSAHPDTAGKIAEANEGDNSLAVALNITKPELVIDTVIMSPVSLQRGGSTLITYKIKNLVGNWVPDAHVVVGLYDASITSGNPVVWARDSHHNSNRHGVASNLLTDTLTLSIPPTIIPKKYRLYAYVDCARFVQTTQTESGTSPETRLKECLADPSTAGQIPEQGTGAESNNSKFINDVEVLAPDLQFLATAAADTIADTVSVGATLNFVVTIKNTGGNTGTFVRLAAGLFSSTSTTPSATFDTIVATPVATNGTVRFSRSFTIPSSFAGQKFLFKAYADCSSITTSQPTIVTCLSSTSDAVGTIPESSEANNVYADSLYVRHIGTSASVSVPNSGLINEGSFANAVGSVFNSSNQVISGAPLTWVSDDTTVAVVDQTGKVTGKRPGITWVRARHNSLEGSAKVSIRGAYGVANKRWHGKVSDDWFDAGNWVDGQLPLEQDTIHIAKITGGRTPRLATGGFNASTIMMEPGIGFNLNGHNLHIRRALLADTISNGIVRIDADNVEMRGVVPNLAINKIAKLAGSTVATGNVEIIGTGAELKVNGATLKVTGKLKTDTSGSLTMLNAADVVEVQDSAIFKGGDETGKLTEGMLKVAGSFTTGDYFVPRFTSTNNHKVIFTGTSQNVNLGDTGVGTHFFNKVEIPTGASVTFATPAKIKGEFKADGSVTFASTATIEAASTFNGTATFQGTTTFQGDATLKGNVTIEGTANFQAATTIQGPVTVASTAVTEFKGTTTVEAEVKVLGNGEVKTDTTTIIDLKGNSGKIDLGTTGKLENKGQVKCTNTDGSNSITVEKVKKTTTSQVTVNQPPNNCDGTGITGGS